MNWVDYLLACVLACTYFLYRDNMATKQSMLNVNGMSDFSKLEHLKSSKAAERSCARMR